MSLSVIIPAAGTGSRMNHKEKKQFIKLHDIPVLVRTLQVFEDIEEVDELVIVTGCEDIVRVRELLVTYGLKKCTQVVEGGKRRQDSVFNALGKVKGDVVMIHDGARPFISREIILEHIKRIKQCQALITAVPTKDTIKVVKHGLVESTLDRSVLYNVQTPQTFYTEMLKTAYQKAVVDVTDDASLMESMGVEVEVVEGCYNNIKITTPEDLKVGVLILRGDS